MSDGKDIAKAAAQGKPTSREMAEDNEQSPGTPSERHSYGSDMHTPPQGTVSRSIPHPDDHVGSPSSPALGDAASQVKRLQTELNVIKTILEQVKLEQQRIADQPILPYGNASRDVDASQASSSDVLDFVRHVDSLVWLRTKPGSMRRDEAIFAKDNLIHLRQRLTAWDHAMRGR